MASTWPATTLSPDATLTAVTVPDAPKLRSSVWAAATVPSADTVWVSEPRVTVTSCFVVVVVTWASLSLRTPNHHTATAATTTTPIAESATARG